MRGSAIEGEGDLVGIEAGSDAEVVFELSLIAVVGEVDSGINGFVVHAAILRNVAMPLRRIIADEIVAFAGQKFGAGDAGSGVGSVEAHADDVVGGRCGFGPGA